MSLQTFSRKIWVRISLASIVTFALTLVIVVVAVYQLTIIDERNDLDALLRREGSTVIQQLSSEISAVASDNGSVDASDLETIASRSLAMHPGSSLHMTVIRIGDSVFTSARGPGRLELLRDTNQLPNFESGFVRSSDGIRARSQTLALANGAATVDTLGDDQAIVDHARTIAGRVLLVVIIGIFAGAVALAMTIRRSTRTLEEVSQTVRQTRLDNLSARVQHTTGTGEVAVLARDVNSMLEDLAIARAAREELIASVSHEIRTPLAAARGHVDLLRDGRAEDTAITVSRIDRELTRMTRLVDDLLALPRSSDPEWLALRLVSVQSVLDELATRMTSFDAKQVEIATAPDVMIEVDPDRILQALTNLTQNAILHTPSDTSVWISTRIEHQSVKFAVRDNGPGIPNDVLESFGEAFVRGSSTGSGLGLAVARAVTTSHGGQLSVESSNVGTTITVSIPIERVPQ